MVSESMGKNQKEGRNEKGLVRMSQSAREHMGFESQVELWPETKNAIEGKIKQAVLLQIFHSFKNDVNTIKKLVNDGELSKDDSKRVGFVTQSVYDKIINGSNNKNNVWISETIEDVPIGADPEFLLFSPEGEVLNAGMVSGFSYHSKLGSDGAMAELRPDPSTTAEGLVQNIKKLFNDDGLTGPIKDLQWKSGCYYHDGNRAYPIGGHVHYGNPLKIAEIDQTDRLNFFRSVNKIIDELLAVPLIRLDGYDGNGRRTLSNMGRYGWFGELRMSSGRLEHRTLSGVWLAHPELSVAVLGTAKAIIEEIYRHVSDNKFSMEYITHPHASSNTVYNEGFDLWGEMPLTTDLRCTKSSKEMHELLNKANLKYVNASFVKKWYNRMKEMSTYEQYSDSIDKLYAVLKAPEKKILSLNTDLKDCWVNDVEFDI